MKTVKTKYLNLSVNENGEVYRSGEPAKIFDNGKGYATVRVTKSRGVYGWQYLHRMVYEAFNGDVPKGLDVRHLDHDKRNNKLSNLTIGTRKENMADSMRSGRINKGESHYKTKLSNELVLGIKALLKNGLTVKAASSLTGVPPTTISHIKLGNTWAHIN